MKGVSGLDPGQLKRAQLALQAETGRMAFSSNPIPFPTSADLGPRTSAE